MLMEMFQGWTKLNFFKSRLHLKDLISLSLSLITYRCIFATFVILEKDCVAQ